MIELNNLRELTISQIRDLVDKETVTFEIYVPKSTQLHFSDSLTIAYDYANAAYIGQRLSEISTLFKYNEVPVENHESILFEIQTSNKEELASILLYASYLYGFNDNPEDENGIDNEGEEVEHFLSNIEDGKTISACPFFIDIYYRFIDEEENYDINEEE